MKIKVHWIIDGTAEIESEDLENAEKSVNEILDKAIKNNSDFSTILGAKSIQGKAFFPGSDEN